MISISMLLLVIALLLSAYEVARSRGTSLLSWAVLCIAVVLLMPLVR